MVLFLSLSKRYEKDQLLDSVSLYKVACSYPLSDDRLPVWLAEKDTVIVIEEKRAFLETEVRRLVNEKKKLNVKIWGKNFDEGFKGFPSQGGINVRDCSRSIKDCI